ncbi:MAG: phosphatidate cytidylyltransferase [Gammaproteobacteria bacterium]
MLKQRVLTALLLAAALLTVLFMLPEDVGVILFGILMLIGAWEWSALAGLREPVARAAYTFALALLIGFLAWWVPTGDMPQPLLWLQLGLWIGGGLLLTRFPVPIPGILSAPAGLAVLALAWLALSFILKTDALGPAWLLFIFLLVACADVGAYFAGRTLGRVKLAPRISPGKTWEGLVGGLVAVALACLVAAWWFGVPSAPLVFLGLAAAGLSVVGDLSVSMLKRNRGLKDSGSIFPGHGGVLDRVDSLLAALPVLVMGLKWLVVP